MKDKFIPNSPLITPVLFLIFNRPVTTQKVFNAIRQAKPRQLFVAADGPREDKEGEKKKCEQSREIIEQVDWDCEVKTLFRDKNLGCKIAVSSAIDWFFENVEEGIILEDDCLPSQSFFWFCQELLVYYRNDTRIMHIGGCPHVVIDNKRNNSSYYFSKYSHIWGWATWRRAWKYYDVNLSLWPKAKLSKRYFDMFHDKREAYFRKKIWDKTYNNFIDTWDYQWLFAVRSQSGLSILPIKNLINNIGFGEEATHTKQIPEGFFEKKYEIYFPIQHPEFVLIDSSADAIYAKRTYKTNIIKRLLSKVKKIF